MLYIFAKRTTTTREEFSLEKNHANIKLIGYCGAMLLLPNIFLLFLYNNNQEATIRYEHLGILAAILAIMALGLFLGLRAIAKNSEGAFLAALLFWVLFWFFEQIYSIIVWYSPVFSRETLLAAVLFATLLFVGIVRRYYISFEKVIPVFATVTVMLYVLFVFNAIPLFQTGPLIVMAEEPLREDEPFTLTRRQFNVDTATPSPDIFWLHTDGALSFAAVERFFGDPQDEFRAALHSRGFVINENAILNAGGTWVALPTLFSPTFYDNYWGALLAATDRYINTERRRVQVIGSRLARDSIVREQHIDPYYELFHAFMAADYTVVLQGFPGLGLNPLAANRFYNIFAERTPLTIIDHDSLERQRLRHPFLAGSEELLELMTMTSPFSIIEEFLFVNLLNDLQWLTIPTHSERVQQLTVNSEPTFHEQSLFRNLLEAFTLESPKFVYTQPSFWHGNRWWYHWPSILAPIADRDPFDHNQYMVAHNFGNEVLLNMIDLILEHNPNAVIVIQADHGFHLFETQLILEEMGFSEEERFELIHATLSAVRIPPQYGGLEEPLHPKNITRELVNRFVGVNYELLP